MKNANFLRTLVKTDSRTAQQIAKLAGIHANTVTALTKPDMIPYDKRLHESITKLAAVYGYSVKINVDFVPIGNGDENRS